MRTVKVQYAKTHLSALIATVEQGDEVVISRGDQPVAKLVALEAPGDRSLGFVAWKTPATFFAELTDDELAAWEGTG